MLEDAQFFGLDPALFDDVDQSGVWPEHQDAVSAFLEVQTQWNASFLQGGGVIHHGLNYPGAQAGLAMAGRVVTPELWVQMRLIEDGAKAALNGG